MTRYRPGELPPEQYCPTHGILGTSTYIDATTSSEASRGERWLLLADRGCPRCNSRGEGAPAGNDGGGSVQSASPPSPLTPIRVPCEGSGCPVHRYTEQQGMCQMCGHTVIIRDGDNCAAEHDRPDILAMLAQGYFDEAGS